jgi:uncharacterized protein (DUF1697 family)
MPRYVALLRSVNVAGHGRITSEELRASFAALGYEHVTTYIQTGNIVFNTPTRSAARVTAAITGQLSADLGSAPTVIVRTLAELQKVVASSPYAARKADPARHHVTFLTDAPTKARLAALAPPPSGRDELVVSGREVYVSTPDGYHDTRYNGAYLERHLAVMSTTRNWNTVTKLCVLAEKS